MKKIRLIHNQMILVPEDLYHELVQFKNLSRIEKSQQVLEKIPQIMMAI